MSNKLEKKPKNALERKRFYTLLALAYSVAKDLGEDNSRVEQYLHYAMEWYREFSFDSSMQVKSVEIPMSAWKQIDFPVDMVDWVRVGFKYGDTLLILTQDAYIPKTHKIQNGTPIANTPTLPLTEVDIAGPSPAERSTMWVWDGAYGCAKYYGYNINYNYLGYFDVDWSQRVINFKATAENFQTVYLEYISDGIECGAMTIVNPYGFKMGKDWVKWQRKENSDRYSLGEKDRAEKQYLKSLQRYNERMIHMDLDDVQEALAAGWTLVVLAP